MYIYTFHYIRVYCIETYYTFIISIRIYIYIHSIIEYIICYKLRIEYVISYFVVYFTFIVSIRIPLYSSILY